ncbi:hypothetical protein ACFLYO_02185 [Chloroflexota bacterium]
MAIDTKPISIQGRTKLPSEQDLGGPLSGGMLFEVGQLDQTRRIAPDWPSTKRDYFLRKFWHAEDNEIVQGVIAGLVARIGGFSWSVTGMRGVNHFQDVLQEAEFGAGFTALLAKTLQDFWTQDSGAFWELIGSETNLDQLNGPLVPPVTGVAHLDASRCILTGNPIYPVQWSDPVDGTLHRLHWSRVVHMADLPSPDTRHRGYGFCAMSRLVASGQFMQMLSRHKLEAVQEQLPPGLLLLSGIQKGSFSEAREQYEEERDNLGLDFMKPLMHLEGLDPTSPVKAEYIPFSDLPQWFVERDQVDVYARLVALAFGIDSQDVLPLANTSMGTGTQSEVLHQKARGKGIKQVIKLLERTINQRVLPPNLEFSFEAQDTAEEQEQAELAAQYLNQAEQLHRLGYSQMFITRWLLERGVMDEEDLAAEEEATQRGDDVQSEPDKVGGPDGKAENMAGNESADPKVAKASNRVKRSQEFTIRQMAYHATLRDLLARRATGDIRRRTFRHQFHRAIVAAFNDAFAIGLTDGGVDAAGMTDEENRLLRTRITDEQHYADQFVDSFEQAIRDAADSTEGIAAVHAHYDSRLAMWATTLSEIYQLGLLSARRNQMLEWKRGATGTSCPTCLAADGQRHRAKDWDKYNLRPQSDELLCGGHHCDCTFVPTKEKAKGRLDRIPTKINSRGWRSSGSGWTRSRRKALTDTLWAFTGRQAA